LIAPPFLLIDLDEMLFWFFDVSAAILSDGSR
jgi:hypothetical protein